MTNIQGAEDKALQLINELAIDSAPVSVVKIAEDSGVSVVPKFLEDDVSGFLLIKNDKAVIAVNQNHHPHRQRFTIAHELGHYLLHNEQQTFFMDSGLSPIYYRDQQSSEGINPYEIEANAFAAALLMPKHILNLHLTRRQFDLYNPLDVAYLASKFGVSEQALTIRLMKLDFVT